jgi:hypothetical protein
VQVEQLNSYLETLPCQTTKQVLPLDDANLVTHFLLMYLAEWQTQYMEKMTPVSTRTLLLILEKIEYHTEVEAKPSSVIKPKGTEGKCKMESMDSHIPKKPKQVGFCDKQCTANESLARCKFLLVKL